MIENKTIAILNCIDDNLDEIRIVESLVFNTRVLNIKCFNTIDEDEKIMTEVILDMKGVKDLRSYLDQWINNDISNNNIIFKKNKIGV